MNRLNSFAEGFLVLSGIAILCFTTEELNAQNCAVPPPGLVSWWAGENSAQDQAGTNHGVLQNGTALAVGLVSNAFSFDGVNDYISIPASASLNAGIGPGFTIECWIRPENTSAPQVIAEWNNGSGGAGVHLWHSIDSLGGWGSLFANVVDSSGGDHYVATVAGVLVASNLYHVALTYDKTSGVARIFVNGLISASASLGSFTPLTSYSLYLATRISGQGAGSYFDGLLDEVSIYSQALTTNEIQAIYNAGAAGKCTPGVVPYIVSQPTNQTVVVGADVTFSVTASGTVPLSYQWNFNGTNLAGATGSSLTKTNVQLSDAGNYAVEVSNSVTTITSSNAVLTVNAVQPITLLNVNFAANQVKTGSAATGLTGSDFWNDLWFPFQPSAGLGGLKRANGTATATGLTVQNGGGHTGFTHPDLMYQSCCYAQDFGVITLTVTNLPAGEYDFYLYGHAGANSANTVFQLLVGSDDFGHKFTATNSSWSLTNWVEGAQYVVYRGVTMTNGGAPVVVKCHPGVSGYTYLNGIQIMAAGPTPPLITTQPTNQSVLVGESATFSVVVTGAAPLGYQWQFYGTNLPGATASVLALTNVQLSQAGPYGVVVSNSSGSITSSNALLIVNSSLPCVPLVSGLVSWWAGNGSALDGTGPNNGGLQSGTGFATGKVGDAFSFDGVDDFVSVPPSTSLNVGAGNGLTIECWIKPSNLTRSQVIVEWNDGVGGIGAHFWHSNPGAGGLGSLLVNLTDTLGSSHIFASSPNLLAPNAFQHVAVTYDKNTGIGKIFYNGQPVATTSLGSFSPRTSYPLYFGTRVSGPAGVGSNYAGLIDEVSIYNHALTDSEIQAIYAADSFGKCTTPVPPYIVSQPTNQTVSAGATATFAVVAGGSPPLSYQWSFNGLPVGDATNASLTFINVGTNRAGVYAVSITNLQGSMVSSNAILTVNPPPPCAPPPAGMFGWWAAEGSAGDSIGNIHGTLYGGMTFVPGKVGQAFSFDGTNDSVTNSMPGLTNILDSYTMELWTWPTAARASTPENTSGIYGSGNQRYAIFPYAGPTGGTVGSGISVGTNGVSVFEHGNAYLPALLVFDTPIIGWTHIAVVYSNRRPSLYINSVLVRSGLTSVNPSCPSTWLGERGAASANQGYYAGLLDEVSIYDRSLSAAEIQAIYNAGNSGKCAIPVPPSIFSQPTNQTVSAGAIASLAVMAGGSPPLSYQWRFNGLPVADATNASLTLTNVETSHAGVYAVTVTNLYGSVLSSNATLTVLVYPPTITLQPTNQIRVVGETATLVATASGTAPLSYQWSFNGDILHGATNASLVFSNVGTDQVGAYAVTVTNLFGSETSSNATLAVVFLTTNLFDDFDPGIELPQWSSFGGTVQATNHGGFISPSNSLWFGGAGSRFAVTRSINTTNSWDLRFHLRFPNGFSPFWDRPELPNDGVVVEYSTNAGVNWIEFGRYNTTLFYNWTPVSVLIPERAKVPAAQIRWRQLANSGSSSDHWALDEVLLTEVATPPQIVDQPQSQTVNAGGTVVFMANADGSLPLHYQWRVGGTDIPGATNSSLTLSNVQPSQAGNYSLRIANVAGVSVSSNAVLKVIVISAFANGQLLTGAVHYSSGSTSVALTNHFPGGLIFYTLDGSAPSFASSSYNGPFLVSQDVILRAIGYRADFLESGELEPVTILMVPGFRLSVSSAGGGGITLNPPGGDYASNTVVSLTAVPDPGWTFLKWLADASGSVTSTNVTVTRDKSVQAVFGTTLNTTAAGGGNVLLNPAGGLYPYGSGVQLSAVPTAGNQFGIWGNAASGNVNPLFFIVTNANPTVSALFGPVGGGQSALTVVAIGRGQIAVTPRANSYATGSDVVITATPETGQSFLGWDGDASGLANPLALKVDTNKLVYANFSKRPRLVLSGDAELIHREGARLLLSSGPGDSIEIDWSTNLSAWTQLIALTNSFGIEQVADSAATNSSLRFYRALLTE